MDEVIKHLACEVLDDIVQAESELLHAQSDLTIQEAFDQFTQEQKDFVAFMIGAIMDDADVADNDDLIDVYRGMSYFQQALSDLLVGAATDEEFEHSVLNDGEYLEHFGVKGMKLGVRKDRDKSPRARADRTLSGASKKAVSDLRSAEAKAQRQYSRDRVKTRKGNLADAYSAALKTKGHRLLNALLGDKTYWKRTLGIQTASIAAIGISGAVMAATGPVSLGTLMTVGVTIKTASTVAGAVNIGDNTLRAIRGNARIRKEAERMSDSLTKSQTSGSAKTRRMLIRNGGLRNKDLKPVKTRES